MIAPRAPRRQPPLLISITTLRQEIGSWRQVLVRRRNTRSLRRQRIAALSVSFTVVRIPVARAHPFYQSRRYAVVLDRQRVISVVEVDAIDKGQITLDVNAMRSRSDSISASVRPEYSSVHPFRATPPSCRFAGSHHRNESPTG